MRERIAIFFGRELAESLLWIEGRLENLSLWGYVAHPSQSRSSTKSQFLFLGGRYVRDRSLSHALNEAYRGLLMVGRNPVAFLNLEMPPEEVDVNVHPTKIEVRFRDPQRVYSHLLSTLRQTFLSSDLHSRLQAAQDEPVGALRKDDATVAPVHGDNGNKPLELSARAPDRQAVASWFEPASSAYAGGPPQIPEGVGRVEAPAWSRSLPGRFEVGAGDEFDEFESRSPAPRSAAPFDLAPVSPAASIAPGEASSAARERASALTQTDFREAAARALKAIQVHNSYLIAETNDGMMVIDQHALHERILYEELRQRVAGGKAESQGLLIPEPVHLTADEAASVLEERELLGQLGLEIEEFGGDTLLVRSMPAMLGHLTPERLVRDLADHLHTQPMPPTREGLVAELLHMIACKAAVKAGDKLTAEEVDALLDRRHLVADSHHCPHGRPTALVFTKAELEKQFGRV
jgi:DNA mismatch repair protein MutL